MTGVLALVTGASARFDGGAFLACQLVDGLREVRGVSSPRGVGRGALVRLEPIGLFWRLAAVVRRPRHDSDPALLSGAPGREAAGLIHASGQEITGSSSMVLGLTADGGTCTRGGAGEGVERPRLAEMVQGLEGHGWLGGHQAVPCVARPHVAIVEVQP